MVIDVITYNGEDELFEIRYNVLKDYVEEFRVVEFDETFSGKSKQSTFTQKWPKVKYYFVTKDVWSRYEKLAKSSPNTVGADHWKTEFAQKESIKDCLTDLQDDDIVFIGDCDEIWDQKMVYTSGMKADNSFAVKLKLRVYTYYLNLKSSEEFWGTLYARYDFIKDKCLNHIRTDSLKVPWYGGWHFTSLKDNLLKKLTDSYTEESYATKEVLDNLENNINNNKDFLGRNFEYKVDESEWPDYLKDNKEKYKNLMRNG